MPVFEITAPDGKVVEVTGPEGSTLEQAIAYAQQIYKPEQIKRETGATGAFKSGVERLKGEGALLAGKLGLMDTDEAQAYKESQYRKAEKKFQPTEKTWGEAPVEKFLELAGGSAPYMIAPVAAGASALLLPEAAAAAPVLGGLATLGTAVGTGAAGLTSAAQFTGSNLARQMEEGKSLSEASLPKAAAASVPQAVLDQLSMRMIPGVRQIFSRAGTELSEKAAKEIAERGLLSTIGEYGGKAALTAGAEGTTEAAQQVFERLQAGLNLTDKEAQKEYFDNFIGGAVLGGTLAVPGHYFEKSTAKVSPGVTPTDERLNVEETAPVVPAAETPVTPPDIQEVGREAVGNPLLWAQGPAALAKEQEDISLAAKQAQMAFDQEQKEGQIGGHIDTSTPMGQELAATQQQMEGLAKEAQPLFTPQFQPTFETPNVAEQVVEQQVEQAQAAPAPQVNEEVLKKVEDIKRTIAPQLKRFGLGDVGLRIVDSINNGQADGSYARNLVTVALDTDDHLGTIRHESIHALKDLGAFKTDEWQLLSNKAKTEWIPQFIGPDRLNAYKEQYLKENNGNLSGFDEYIQEEAIADAFRYYNNKMPAGAVGNLMYRLKQFFKSLQNTFRGYGFNTSDKIFTGIEESKYKPSQQAQAAEKYSYKSYKPTPAGRGVIAEVAPNPLQEEVEEKWNEMSQGERLQATEAVARKAIPQVLDELGLKGYSYRFSSGKYQGKLNPNVIIDAPENATEAELHELASAVGYVLDQQSMVAFDEFNTSSGYQNGFVKIEIPADLGGRLNDLRKHISDNVPAADADTVRDNSILFGNFSAHNDKIETISDEDFKSQIIKAVESFDYDGEIGVSNILRFHSELVWPDSREDYLKGTRYGNGENVQRGEGSNVRGQGSSRLEYIASEGIKLRDKWIAARKSATASGEKPSTSGIPPIESEYGTPQKGSVSAVGVHYSQNKRNVLSSEYYGKGLKGAERNRLSEPENKDIRNRIYFYVSKGKGVFPESGVGGKTHVVKLNNLYDAQKDELGILKGIKQTNADERASEIERRIKSAGFDGYLSMDIGPQGYAVLLGNHNINMKGEAPSKLSIRAPKTEAFKKWFGNSVTVDANGEPMVLYHGTASDIKEFKPKQANAIFVTARPQFAESFSGAGESYLKRDMFDKLSNDERRDIFKRALEVAKKDGSISPQEYSFHKARLNSMDTSWNSIPPGIEVEVNDILENMLPTRANIMPLFVRAENPFNYSNKDQVRDVVNWLRKNEGLDDRSAETLEGRLLRGSWQAIEREETQRAIKALGHDSFYVLEAGTKNLAVYSPSQIKSATGNYGTYDIENPDIRYSFKNAPPQRKTKLEEVKTAGERVQDVVKDVQDAMTTDQNNFWGNFRTKIVDAGDALTRRFQDQPIFDAKGRLRADLLNRARAQNINLIKNGLTSGTIKLHSDGTLVVVEDKENNYAHSQVLADRLNNNQFVKDSGMDGRNYVAEVARALRAEEIEAEDAAHNAATGENRQRNKAISKEQIAWANQQLKNVPELEDIFKIWKNINTSLLNLWENTGLLDEKAADEFRSKKRYVSLAKSFEDMQEEMDARVGFPTGGLKSVKKVHALKGSEQDVNIWENLDKQYAMMVAAAYQNQVRKVALEGMVGMGVAQYTNYGDMNANVRYKDPTSPHAAKNGMVSVIVNPVDLSAFEAFHYEMGPVLKAMQGATRVLRAGALLNPMFWIRQLVRDPIHAALTNSPVITPLHSAKEFMSILAKQSEEAKILSKHGVIGPVGSTVDLQEFLEQAGSQYAPKGKVKGGLDNMIHKLMEIHEASDAATRVGIYKKAYKEAISKGATPEQAENMAVHAARESINFSVHGNGKTLNAARHMIPFLSAAITSLDTVYRAATGYGLPKEQREEAKRMFKQRAAMMTAMSLTYAMMMQDDDEYKKLPDYVRDGNWLIRNPFGEGFIKIPIPYEVGFLTKTIPEATVRYFAGTSTGKQVVKSYLNGLAHNLPGDAMPLPQLVKPLYEVMSNYSMFTGQSIESIGEMHKPVELRGANASETAKMLSQAGLHHIGLSPAKIDHLLQGYLAELGLFSTFVIDKAIYAAKGETPMDKNLAQEPFFRSFLTDPTKDRIVGDFYEVYKSANEVAASFNELKKTGQMDAAKELLQDEDKKKLVLASTSFNRIAKQLTEINNQIKYIKQNQDIPSDERLRRVNELEKRKAIVARQYKKITTSLGIEE